MTVEPRQSSDGGLVLRTARKRWSCQGSGGRPNRHAEDCPGVIEPGEQYVECLWEATSYESGTRHALICARVTHNWPEGSA
jgi:hypothetical protein